MTEDSSRSFGVKICGITSAVQAQAICALGADMMGLNFWPQSRRYVRPSDADLWAEALREHVKVVGVFVNPSLAALKEIIGMGLIDVIQLHGDEDSQRVARVMALGLPVIKALQVRDRESLKMIRKYPCETILLDAYCPGVYGGEGKTFPWELAIEARDAFPSKQFILAGGLTPDNVGLAVSQVRPTGVDVASGVESAPGVKDLTLVGRFITEAKIASAAIEESESH